MLKSLISLIIFTTAFSANAQYHKILPKGVRTVIYKNITSNIKSTFNQSGDKSPIKFRVEADIDTLQEIEDPDFQAVLNQLRQFPEAFNALSAGTHQVDGEADVNVEVFAFGYGLTKKSMIYVGIPLYDARVRLRYKRVSGSTQEEVASILQNDVNNQSGAAQVIGNVVEQVYDIDAGLIQSAFTNGLGYNQLGDWQGQGLGDIEFGYQYVLKETDTYGIKLSIGGIAPTGYVDDPDTLQDISFGNGQWDTFAELGGGWSLSDDTSINLYGRYTYQFASDKELRIPTSEEVPISNESGDFNEKLGNKYLISFSANQNFNDWFSVSPSLTYEYTESARYDSNDTRANRLLSSGTESEVYNLKLLASFSTTRLYQQKKFILPADINFSYQTTVGGFNIPKADLLELELRMFF